MGIAKFYGWLKRNNYKGAIQNYIPDNVSSFSLDLNGLIHRVAQEVYAYGEGENPIRQKLIRKTDPKILEAQFQMAFGAKLAEVVASVQPQDTLVLAVDGVAPQAKIAQQRQRRFRAAMEAEDTKPVFDSASITPGTDFMMRLDNYIQRWIISAKATLPAKVIYSSHMVPGEGEHKIFGFFRDGEVVGDGAHVVYGMDADLIMLSLLSPLDNIFLMREDLSDVIDIDNLRLGIKDDLGTSTAISDFVVMIFLLGNDFLPHLVTLGDMEEAIDTMIRIYQMSGEALTDNGTINSSGLTMFLKALSLEEPRLLELESTRDVKHPSQMMELATQRTEVVGVGQAGVKTVKKARFDPKVFRGAWYDNAFGLKESKLASILVPDHKFGVTNRKVVEMTKSYLSGIYWVFQYYRQGKDAVNTDYVYRYLYGPLLADLAAVADKFIPAEKEYQYDPEALEINPVHQLLSVLPLRSKALLPTEVAHLMKPDSIIGDYYPEKQLIDRQGYNTDWQGVLLINFVDMRRIMAAVEETSVFTPARVQAFSPALSIVLVKDPTVVELERRARKFRRDADAHHQTGRSGGRGRGRGYGDRSGGRGYGDRSGRGRGYRGGRGSSPKRFQPSNVQPRFPAKVPTKIPSRVPTLPSRKQSALPKVPVKAQAAKRFEL